MNKSKIFSFSLVIIFSTLSSISYSQMEISIKGNVVIEQINNNQKAGELKTSTPINTGKTTLPTKISTPTITTTSTTYPYTTKTTTTKTTIQLPLPQQQLQQQ
jgi:hypothetical protein